MKNSQYEQSFILKLFIGLCLAYATLSGVAHAQLAHNYDCSAENANVIMAARNGKFSVLESHHKAGCKLPKQDKRGFTLYDLAALNSDEDTMAWLLKIGYAKEGQYSTRLYKLVQTGLRFLNFDAGVIDGKMNAATKEGITDFQKANKLKQTGEISPEWLAFFDRKLIKKTQTILANLGYSSGGADGIIGPNTRTAMQAFRQERSMPAQDYGYIDDQLIYQIMMAENEATKQEIARREAERAARIKAQQAAQQQEIARRRAQAQKEAARARQQAEAAAKKAEAQRIAKEKALQEEQARLEKSNQLVIQQGSPNTQRPANSVTKITAQPAKVQAQTQQAQDVKIKQLAEVNKAQLEAEKAKRAAIEKRRQEEIAEQKAEAARRAEEKAKAQALAAEREAAKAKSQAELAFKAARSGKEVAVSPDVQVGKPIKSNAPHSVKSGGRFNQLSGRLKFQRDGQQLSQCSIAGQIIDNSWCEPYFPSGENKQCEAVISRTGIVVSLLCK